MEHRARIITSKDVLGKRLHKWGGIPFQLQNLARKHRKNFVGIGYWKDSKIKYVCIATPHDIVYLSGLALKQIKQSFNLGGVEHLPKKILLATKE